MSPRSQAQFEEIRSERRTAILEAALHVFAEHGYSAASVSMVAKEAGVSKGLMYNYFKSKEEVLKTLVVEMFDGVMSVMNVDPAKPLTKDKFIEIVNIGIDIAVKEPKRWKLYMALTFQPNVMAVLMTEMMPRIQPFMTQLAGYFGQKGYEDPIAMMRIYSAMVDGIQLHCILDPQGFPVEKAKQYIIDQFA